MHTMAGVTSTMFAIGVEYERLHSLPLSTMQNGLTDDGDVGVERLMRLLE